MYSLLIEIFSPDLSVAVKLISSRIFSIIVCNLLAPIFSTVEFTSDAMFAIESIPSSVNSSSTFSVSSKALYCLIKQYIALLKTEKVDLEFSEDGIDAIAKIASEVNATVENIGARRLHTIIEKILDEISFTATDRSGEKIIIDKDYIDKNLDNLIKDTDLSKFIL